MTNAARLAQVVAAFRKWLHLPEPGPLYAVLGAVAANLMKGDPLWLMFVGASGSGKTELVQSLTGLREAYPAATLTEASLLSGTSKKDRTEEATGGLLKEIGDFGIIVCKDFTSVLSMNREALRAVLAALREVYDGSWTRPLGVDGGRRLSWKGKAGLILGCTPVIDSHHAVISVMGERFVFYRLPELDDDAEEQQTRRAHDRKREEKRMREELSRAVVEFFADLELPADPPPLSEEEQGRLSALAMLAARCRSAVERDGYQRTIELILPSEVSTRLALNLEALFTGMLAVGVERRKAWEIVVKVGLDSMPALRRALFDVLVSVPQKLDTDDVAQRIGYPPTTTRRGLEDLAAHRVVERHPGNGSVGDYWELSAWARQKYEAATAPLPEMSDSPATGSVPEMSGESRAPGGNGSVPEMSVG